MNPIIIIIFAILFRLVIAFYNNDCIYPQNWPANPLNAECKRVFYSQFTKELKHKSK